MFTHLITIFRIPELRTKIFITLAFLAVYRIGYFIPLPMVNQAVLAENMRRAGGGPLGQILNTVSLFSGGNLSQSCIFSLGIMPYISASIIMQLLSSGIVPSLERLKKEGAAGQKKINEFTRYLAVPICLVQGWLIFQSFTGRSAEGGMGAAVSGLDETWGHMLYFGIAAVLMMTAGTLFLMWLGEQIDEYGIGNGISLIIMAGIISRLPDAIGSMLFVPGSGKINPGLFTLGSEGGDISLEKVLILALLFVGVIVGVIAITKAQRRIPMQSAKHVRGRRMVGGTKNFLPMKLNTAGVMPVIFASTLLILPMFVFQLLHTATQWEWANTLSHVFGRGSGWVYNVCYVALIFVFSYFWVAVMFNPKEVSENLRESGSFIPGYRPGKSTADYLERVLMRVTFVGAAFLGVIAIIPSIVQQQLSIQPTIAQFFGGTSLLIVISVALDLVQKINTHLVMRNYPGLTDD